MRHGSNRRLGTNSTMNKSEEIVMRNVITQILVPTDFSEPSEVRGSARG